MRRAPFGKPNKEITGMWCPDDLLADMNRKAPPASPNGPRWCLSGKTIFSSLGLKYQDRFWKRKQLRCPKCQRRLLPVTLHCIGGEFSSWALPPHKEPAKKKAKPKRRERKGRLP